MSICWWASSFRGFADRGRYCRVFRRRLPLLSCAARAKYIETTFLCIDCNCLRRTEIPTGHNTNSLSSIDLNIPFPKLWEGSKRSIVWDFYEASKSKTGHVNYGPFFTYVTTRIENRSNGITPTATDNPIEGKWLRFSPYNALFEDVAQIETEGFFGSGDCPPPAFWVHVTGETIVSFIPQKYLAMASIGVDICVNDTLSWIPEN